MRTLTSKLTVNNETFQPEISLLLDGEETGVTLTLEPTLDTGAAPSVEDLINATLDELNSKQTLSEEEMKYFKRNFEDLVKSKHE